MEKYKRVLLKLSGEALMGKKNYGIDQECLSDYVQDIASIHAMGIEIGIVIGGGNIFRGLKGAEQGFDRVKGDYMGMLATVINGLALQSAFEQNGIAASLVTAIRMEPVGKLYNRPGALEDLINKKIVIFTAGTGNPFFTTDTAAALRAVEIGADVLLKGTRVDGVYSADPEKDPVATKFDRISFDEVYQKGLNVMDLTAFTLCRENDLPIIVFDMNKAGNLKNIISGEKVGTLVKN